MFLCLFWCNLLFCNMLLHSFKLLLHVSSCGVKIIIKMRSQCQQVGSAVLFCSNQVLLFQNHDMVICLVPPCLDDVRLQCRIFHCNHCQGFYCRPFQLCAAKQLVCQISIFFPDVQPVLVFNLLDAQC